MNPSHTRRIARRPAAGATPLSLRADLIHPPISQVAHYENMVSERIGQLDLRAAQLAESFGIPFTGFRLNPLPEMSNETLVALTILVESLAHRSERISLERRSGRWGLYFTREPALVAQERRSETVPLRDAPLDVRERFLQKSEQFFREYLALCEDRLGSMKAAVSDGDRTLALLNNIQLRIG